MATAHEAYNTEEQRSVVRILWTKGLIAKDIYKEICPVYGGKCRVKGFPTESRNSLKDVRKSQMMKRKWLRQQSKYFDAVVKRYDKCIIPNLLLVSDPTIRR
jgi:hypothetical protein